MSHQLRSDGTNGEKTLCIHFLDVCEPGLRIVKPEEDVERVYIMNIYLFPVKPSYSASSIASRDHPPICEQSSDSSDFALCQFLSLLTSITISVLGRPKLFGPCMLTFRTLCSKTLLPHATTMSSIKWA